MKIKVINFFHKLFASKFLGIPFYLYLVIAAFVINLCKYYLDIPFFIYKPIEVSFNIFTVIGVIFDICKK